MTKARIVGRCIYCDSKNDLTREHVIPEGICGRISPDGQHGALVLNDASCKVCTKITSDLERQCLRDMMGHFRARTGLVRKDRSTDTRSVKYFDADGIEKWKKLGLSDIPAALMLTSYHQAGFLSGQALGGPYKITNWIKPLDQGALVPGERLEIAKIVPGDFARLLAKIAFGCAVSHFGIDRFTPFVRDFILGKDNEQFGHWVGGTGNINEPPSDKLHETGLRSIIGRQTKNEYLVVDIRLFAMFGGPRNYVIVGQLH